jgi:NAD(P)H-hydrate epimerase
MVICDEKEKCLADMAIEQKNYDAIGVGMALGHHKKTAEALFAFLEKQQQPLVLDADALNILAANTNYLHLIPKHTIITPHPKEFERLFGKTENDYERHQLQLRKATELGIIIILKGAYTAIALPNGNTYFNSTGNPGMATAGSGDVLTGIITALLAQGYLPEDAAMLAVYIHGKAGDTAAANKSQTYITATDIIEALSSIFLSIEQAAV